VSIAIWVPVFLELMLLSSGSFRAGFSPPSMDDPPAASSVALMPRSFAIFSLWAAICGRKTNEAVGVQYKRSQACGEKHSTSCCGELPDLKEDCTPYSPHQRCEAPNLHSILFGGPVRLIQGLDEEGSDYKAEPNHGLHSGLWQDESDDGSEEDFPKHLIKFHPPPLRLIHGMVEAEPHTYLLTEPELVQVPLEFYVDEQRRAQSVQQDPRNGYECIPGVMRTRTAHGEIRDQEALAIDLRQLKVESIVAEVPG